MLGDSRLLSRVAERMYWLGRYLERAEDTARLLGVHSAAALDLPLGERLDWRSLVVILGAEDAYSTRHGTADEENVVAFLLADRDNPGSVASAVAQARENARTTREVMPIEAWECLNGLHLEVQERVGQSIYRRARAEFIEHIIATSQRLGGLMLGTMSHDQVYHFFVLGQLLERADMTTRILDVGGGALDTEDAIDGPVWMSILGSLGASQMYRRSRRERVNGPDTLSYLLHDQRFPRAVAFCLDEIESTLRYLPESNVTLRSIRNARGALCDVEVVELLSTRALARYLDDLQAALAQVHDSIARLWAPPDAISLARMFQTQY
jgi:uncharacterized alpha-E superfamily protein